MKKNDIHFETYLNQKPGVENQPSDSLSIKLIGLENLLPEIEKLRLIRELSISNFIHQNDTVHSQKIRFIELMKVPKFPVETSGFVIDFNME